MRCWGWFGAACGENSYPVQRQWFLFGGFFGKRVTVEELFFLVRGFAEMNVGRVLRGGEEDIDPTTYTRIVMEELTPDGTTIGKLNAEAINAV